MNFWPLEVSNQMALWNYLFVAFSIYSCVYIFLYLLERFAPVKHTAWQEWKTSHDQLVTIIGRIVWVLVFVPALFWFANVVIHGDEGYFWQMMMKATRQ